MSLSEWLLGYHRVECRGQDAEALLNLFARAHLITRGFSREGDRVVFRIAAVDRTYFLRIMETAALSYTLHPMRGLPSFFYRYRRRVGLWLGCAVFAALLVVSRLFVWNITISGNDTVPRSEILQRLDEAGCRLGSFIPTLNFREIYLSVLQSEDRISWISAVRTGTTVRVQVLEKRQGENHALRREGAANLVASRDGQIERLEISSGIAAVSVGQPVKQGTLLVSGVRDLREDRFSVTYAQGRVYARVCREIEVRVPLKTVKIEETERRLIGLQLIFFSKYINIFNNAGISDAFCDTITKEEWVALPGMENLPFCVVLQYGVNRTQTPTELTPAQALATAFSRLNGRIAQELGGAELLEKKTEASFEGEECVLHCSVWCIEDIAQIQEFPAG